MKNQPIRTTVIGSYPFPAWLEFASQNLDQFGPSDIKEMQEDAVVTAIHDQVAAGLDVITDGEQTRFDFKSLPRLEKNKIAIAQNSTNQGHDQRNE